MLLNKNDMNKLFQTLTDEKLTEMGFVQEHDGTGDPRGSDWNMRNEKFHILIDAWCDVKLRRLNPDTDYIPLRVNDIGDLLNVVDWVEDYSEQTALPSTPIYDENIPI